jgi:hypothetical protein
VTAEELAWARSEAAPPELIAPDHEPRDVPAAKPSEAAVPPSSQALLPSRAAPSLDAVRDRGTKGVPKASAATKPDHGRPVSSAFTEAEQREARGDVKGALDVYEGVAESMGHDAEDALFAVGRLRAKLGDTEGAMLAFRTYRERYPGGAYARIVGVRVLDLVSKRGDDGAVVSEANAFLDAYPNDPGAWRFHMARAAVAIKRGDCAAALRDLVFVPDAEASSLRARCAASVQGSPTR